MRPVRPDAAGEARTVNRPIKPRKPYDLVTEAGDYPDWPESLPRRCYVVCTSMRCGSTLLGEAMYRAGEMGCPLEYFHPGFRPALERRWNTGSFPAYLETLYRRRTDPTGAFGAKIFWNDAAALCTELGAGPPHADGEDSDDDSGTYGAIRSVFSALFPRPFLIFLTRRDKLRQAVSTVVAGWSGQWRSLPGVRGSTAGSAPYDYEAIRARYEYALYTETQWERFFASFDAEPFRLTYEELAEGYPGTIRRLLRAAAHPAADFEPPQPRMARQADSASERLIAQFLQDHLARGELTGR